MKLTKILLTTFGGATLALAFSACTVSVNNPMANTAANQSNTAVVNSNSIKPNNGASSDSKKSSATGNRTKNDGSNTDSSKTKCDVTAFVFDTDRSGMNIRDSANKNGGVVGVIPFNAEGTTVHLVSDSADGSGWVQINKAETVMEESVFNGSGWVFADLLGITTAGGRDVKLYESDKNSEVLTTIPSGTEVNVFGCEGKRVLVHYADFYGWLEPDAHCGYPSTLCN